MYLWLALNAPANHSTEGCVIAAAIFRRLRVSVICGLRERVDFFEPCVEIARIIGEVRAGDSELTHAAEREQAAAISWGIGGVPGDEPDQPTRRPLCCGPFPRLMAGLRLILIR